MVHKYYDIETNEGDMSGAFSTYAIHDKYLQNFSL
jgi:hypothetical protein